MTPEQLEKALTIGDQQVADCLSSASEAERRAAAPAILKWHKDLWSEVLAKQTRGVSRDLLMSTVALALLGTATASELKKTRLHLFTGTFETELRVLRERAPDWLQAWAEWYLEDSPYHWPFVRALEKAQLIEQPQTDFYILGMVAVADRYKRGSGRMGAVEFLSEEPELLALVPRLFEVEGSGEFSLAAFDKYRSLEQQWSTALKALADEGRLDRGMLLERSLDALARDFASFRAGWYSRFYQLLQPSPVESLALIDRIFPLLGSPIAPTVSFGVKLLMEICKKHPLPPKQLLPHLEPVWMLPQKATVLSALKLLASTPKSPDWLPQLTLAASHPLPEIQLGALNLLKRVSPQPQAEWRERWTELLPSLEPSVKSQWGDWLGAESPVAAVAQNTDVVGLSQPTPVERCRDLDQLFELATRLLEDPASAIEIELLLEGLFRFQGYCSPLAPALKKRIKTRLKGLDLRRSLAVVLSTWLGEPLALAHPQLPKPQGFLDSRLGEMLANLGRSEVRLLSLPSRSDGSISVQALLQRLHHNPSPLEYDFAQALLRLNLSDTNWSMLDFDRLSGEAVLALKYALKVEGGRVAKRSIWAAAIEFLQHPGPLAPALDFDYQVKVTHSEYSGKTYTHRHFAILSKETNPFLGWRDHQHEPQALRWLGIVCPAQIERFHALGITQVGNNLDWWEANWSHRVYFESLLSMTGSWGYTSAFLAALGLGCKEVGERGVSIDAIGAALGGPLLPKRLGQAMAQAESTGLITHKRWAAAFQELRRFVGGDLLFQVLESYLAKASPEFDSGALLGPLLEIATAIGSSLTEPAARQHLATFDGSGKAAKLAQKLLSL